MASGTLYTYPENFRAYKALIAAQYAGATIKIAPGFVFGETNKTEAFLKKFPLGKVPAFETSDGQHLTESNAIAYYVANNQLRGQSDLEKAEVIQWLGFADSEILPASCAWVFPCLGIMQFNKQPYELWPALLGQSWKPYQNVNRWFTTIINQPQVKAVIGDFKLCEKMAEFDPKKYAEFQGEKAEKKKEEKPPAEPAEELDETELALASEPKSKDPFDALPKGTFNMDDFKRCYSNEDESKSIPYFWEKFDSENYSIWLGEYKYNEELQKVFMSCNLISGMYQRLDKMRKNAFASMCLFGTDANSSISGIWVWRGQSLAFELCQDWQIDYESYQWTKLDSSKEETKKLVQQYLSWTGTDKQGRAFNQGKIFK
ncbi:Elongation factor 1-gamma [Blattella germanica]|nr:Elongation factor 1-gamma [Blattella germanica]